jgi:GntR family transcriptional regulator, transcriptional repressor for pyruvate dehydrogenase complex
VSVTDHAIMKIRDLITSGRINPGDRLPPEQELANLLGISRSSLREAVKALSQAKVLDVRRGDGTYVTSLEPELLMSGLSFVIDLMQDQTLVEIFEVRKLLEPAATALAAQRITEEQIAELRDSLASMRRAHDPEELVVRDIDFHAHIASATGNASLCSILDAISTRAVRARVWRASIVGLKTMTLSQHELILDALSERDPTLARSAATIHVSESERWLREYLSAPRSRKPMLEHQPKGLTRGDLGEEP